MLCCFQIHADKILAFNEDQMQKDHDPVPTVFFPNFACCSAIPTLNLTTASDGVVVIHETGIFQTDTLAFLNIFPRMEDGSLTVHALPPGYTSGCGSSVRSILIK